jgi:DNA-3-methyladenine glycosylase
MKLSSDFYTQSALALAPALLGKLLCRRLGGESVKRRITETEAYVGEDDTACHAHRGKTPRNSVMYERGGTAYVYLCYGIHNLLNIISGKAGEPEGVLIRSIEGAIGPGRLTKALQIDRSLNAIDLTASPDLWLEDDGTTLDYTRTPRIGIDYASTEDKNKLWRFLKKS